MVSPTTPPKNSFVRSARKIYNPLGFSHGYNFILYVIFAGTLTGFVLAHLPYLSIDGIYCGPDTGPSLGAMPGECFWYTRFARYRVGLTLHLATILPAALLAVVQFLPAVRHKCILYHRIAGYAAILLVLCSTVSALMIVDRAVGGDLPVQAFFGFLGLISVGGLAVALYNIKRKQVDQHRAWMLRVWFWMASIVTLRIIIFIAAAILSLPSYKAGNVFHADLPCPQILDTMARYNASLAALGPADQAAVLGALYPSCIGQATNLLAVGAVESDLNGPDATNVAAMLHTTFGTAGVVAWLLHAIGVELYLRLTPKEGERLRVLSYQKQLEAGLRHPGSAGLVLDRFGDMDPWVPPEQRRAEEKRESREEDSVSRVQVPVQGVGANTK